MAKDELTSVDEAQLLRSIGEAVTAAVKELVTVAKLEAGDLFVIGCSTSEVRGSRIGTDSATDVGETIIKAAAAVFRAAEDFFGRAMLRTFESRLGT